MMARDFALVQVAIYDAMLAGRDVRRGRLGLRAIAAGAASEVLHDLFPNSASTIDSAARAELAADVGPPGKKLASWVIGRAVGRVAVIRGRHDGSNAAFTGTPPSGQGVWTGTNPVLPMCGTWKTWVTTSGSEFQPEPPYAFGSPADLRDVEEVADVARNRTAEQIAIVHKWADVSPPSIWCSMLDDRIESRRLTDLEAAHAQAFLSMALADAFVSCWRTKYQYWVARPFQRNQGLVTVIPTPNFPSYTSGHSTISAAAAAVMGALFPDERDYFFAQANEAAMSRLWGGIHFRHDNEQGLLVGERIGAQVARLMHGRLRRPDLAAGME
jgi:hypothetical protein